MAKMKGQSGGKSVFLDGRSGGLGDSLLYLPYHHALPLAEATSGICDHRGAPTQVRRGKAEVAREVVQSPGQAQDRFPLGFLLNNHASAGAGSPTRSG